MCDSGGMDLGFHRRNMRWPRREPSEARIEVLLARLAAHQALSPTARTQAAQARGDRGKSQGPAAIASIFAPALDEASETPASFSPETADLITRWQEA